MSAMRRSIKRLAGGLAAGAALVAAGLAPAAHAAPTLLGQWPLDGSYEDGASDVTPDVSGNGLALKAPVGSVHLGTPSLFGTGATLGTNLTPLQIVSPVLAPAQVTLLVWIKQNGNPGTLRYIAGRGDDGLTCGGSTFAIYSGYPPSGGDPAGKAGLRFYTRSGAGGTPSLTAAPADAAVFNNQWHLIAGTYDGSAARLYVDGVLVGAPVPGFGALKYALGGGSTFYVDGYAEAGCALGANADDWPGPIDDVRLYDRALSASELARLAAAPPGASGPLLVSDESLVPVPTTPAPTTPAPVTEPGPVAAAVKPTKPVAAEQLAAAAGGVAGASKQAAKESLRAALAEAQQAALGAMKAAAGASQVSAAETQKQLSKKQIEAVQADKKVQARLEAMKYGITAEVPAAGPGQVVEAAATIALEKKQGGKVKVQQVVLPPAVGIAGADGKATLQFPVDGQATAAMTKKDVAKAAIAVQAAALESASELAELDQQRLQQAMSIYTQSQELISNVLKKLSETERQITQNLKGGLTDKERKEQEDLKAKAAKLDKEAKKIEQQRDAANQKATQAMDEAVTALINGLAAAPIQIAGGAVPATQLPMATAALTGCKLCALGALRSK